MGRSKKQRLDPRSPHDAAVIERRKRLAERHRNPLAVPHKKRRGRS